MVGDRLGRFTDEEEPLLAGALSKAEQAAEVFVGKGLDHAMNFTNAGPQREKPPGNPQKGGPPKEGVSTDRPSPAPKTSPNTT